MEVNSFAKMDPTNPKFIIGQHCLEWIGLPNLLRKDRSPSSLPDELRRRNPSQVGNGVWKKGKEIIRELERHGISNVQFNLLTCFWDNQGLYVTDFSRVKFSASIEENESWLSLTDLCRDLYYGQEEFDSFLFTTEYSSSIRAEMNAIYEGNLPPPQELLKEDLYDPSPEVVGFFGLLWPTSIWYPSADYFLAAFFFFQRVLEKWSPQPCQELTACLVVIWKLLQDLYHFESSYSLESLFAENSWTTKDYQEVESWVLTCLTPFPLNTQELKSIENLSIDNSQTLAEGLKNLFRSKMFDSNWFEQINNHLPEVYLPRKESASSSSSLTYDPQSWKMLSSWLKTKSFS